MSDSRLRGVIAATATPVSPDYAPDAERLVRHLRYLLDHGCDAINLLGTTGEANSFSLRQRLTIMGAVKQAGLPMDRFMVGTGVCSLEETVVLTQAAADLGFAGALVLPPFFYPGIEPAALVAYVDSLVARLKPGALSLYLYHIPQNTGVPWPVDVVTQLARRHGGLLRGIKDSAGDLAYARSVVAAARELSVFPSSEATLWDADKEGWRQHFGHGESSDPASYQERGWSRQGGKQGSRRTSRGGAQHSRQAVAGREHQGGAGCPVQGSAMGAHLPAPASAQR